METLGPINLAVYGGWPANTGPNTCYGDFGRPNNLAIMIEGDLVYGMTTIDRFTVPN